MPSRISRLVTAFLILALVAATLPLLFRSDESAPAQTALERDRAPRAPENAFVEQLPAGKPAAVTGVADDGLPQIAPTKNLTENLAQHLTREMVARNPEGPQVNDEGVSLSGSSDLAALVEEMGAIPVELQAAIRQEAQVAVPEKDITILATYSTEEVTAYAEGAQAVIAKHLLQPRLSTIFEETPSPDGLNTANVVLELAYLETRALKVPAPLVEFHRSLLGALAHQKKSVALAMNDEDPLRASLVLESIERSYNLAMLRFGAEFERAQELQSISGNQPASAAFAALRALSPFHVTTAHAFWGIGDISFDPAVFGRLVWDFSYKVILDNIKKRIMKRIVDQTINWIQGGGKPQFITNWKGFVESAAKDATAILLQRIAPGLCSPFSALIRFGFDPVVRSPEAPLTCTLDQIVDNIQDFYEDFTSGNWVAYGAVIQPRNNYFGAVIETSDLIEAEAIKAAAAKQQEVAAGQGFISVKQCLQWERYEDEAECVSVNGAGPDYCFNLNYPYKKCLQEKATTPGRIAGDALAKATNGHLDMLFSAQDISAVVSTFVDSMVNRLVSMGERGILGLVSRIGSNSSGGSSGASSTVAIDPETAKFYLQQICPNVDESIAKIKRFYDFAVANEGQLKSDSENFRVKADSKLWANQTIDIQGPVAGLDSALGSLENPAWQPLQLQTSRFTNWLDAVFSSLIKDEDLDLDGPHNVNDPPIQGARGVIRITNSFSAYLAAVRESIGSCGNPDPSGLGSIPDPQIAVESDFMVRGTPPPLPPAPGPGGGSPPNPPSPPAATSSVPAGDPNDGVHGTCVSLVAGGPTWYCRMAPGEAPDVCRYDHDCGLPRE